MIPCQGFGQAREDIRKITMDARAAALKLLSVMAALRFDEKPDRIENILSSTLVDGPVSQDRSITASTDPLASSTWEEVPPKNTMITPVQCKSLWRQFKTETEFTVTQAISAQEAHKRSKSAMPPPWAILLIAILGFNEFMMILRNPLYLLIKPSFICLQTAAAKRCRRYMVEMDEFMSSNSEGFLTDHMTISTAYLKMKILCLNISSEVQADIKIHNQHVLSSSIDLPNIATAVYNTQLCRRLRGFLAACPPSNPSQHVTELLIATADFERQLDSWNISSVNGGVDLRDLFHNYIMVWVQDTRLHLLELCKAEKGPPPGISVHCSSSPFVEHMYDQIIDNLNTYEEVVADIERAIMKALEKQYNEILMPLRDGIPMRLEKQVQKFTRRQSTSAYLIPNQLGTFLNTIKRILDLLHCRVEDILKSWAAYLAVLDGTHVFGEQMNGIVVMFRKKYKKYMQVIVEKLITNVSIARRCDTLIRLVEKDDVIFYC